MSYKNYLLFNNIFLRNLNPSEDELTAARYLVHESARDWYQEENFSSPQRIVTNWIKPLLNQQSLDLVDSRLDENAWYLVAPWDREAPLGLCYVVPKDEELNGLDQRGFVPKGKHWMIKAVELARRQKELNLRWVILTNGVQWRLLDSQSLRRYEAYLEIDLHRLLRGIDDPLAVYLFYRLFRFEDSFERDGDTGQNLLNNLFNQSEQATQATEAYLKTMVSENLSMPGSGDGIMAQLCMGFVNAVDPSGSKVFTTSERDAIYHDATFLLYRLLFILYAEARHLLPMDREDYRSISLSQIIDDAAVLREQSDQNHQKPNSLWERLRTLFNAIHYSDEYLGIPPYNGGLFEDEDKPYLGKCQIRNAFLAEALYALGFLLDDMQEKTPEKIDYCDLSVRHLGSLYEGMIEYKLFIAEETLLARRDKNSRVQYLPASSNTQKPTDEVIQPGRVYFAQSPRERKATGTHYTAEPLVEKLVQQTVGRLLDHRWRAFQPQFQKMKTEVDAAIDDGTRDRLERRLDRELGAYIEQQVLSLKICDPAMGSGHFLVHITHTLTNSILEILTKTPWENPEVNLNAAYWRQLVVERCLYGVDISKMAVELAKLSLWLATMQPGRPLTFLDHHLKHGNSLLGVRLEEIAKVLSNDPLNQQTVKTRMAESKGQYRLQTPSKIMETIEDANQKLLSITQQVVNQVEDIHVQENAYEEVQNSLQSYKRIGDLIIAQKMGLVIEDHDLRRSASGIEAEETVSTAERMKVKNKFAVGLLDGHSPFHWELEFPEIFIKSIEVNREVGFDIIIGNPPFLGGKKISSQLGGKFLKYLKNTFIPNKGAADLSAYFFRRAHELTNDYGYLGMVATNTISQGDTRETGLAPLLQKQAEIVFAERFVSWPGDASVEVSLIVIGTHKSIMSEVKDILLIDGVEVDFISSWLDDWQEKQPYRLKEIYAKAFNGDFLHSNGFLLSKQNALELLEKNVKNIDCLFPYLSGMDINRAINQQSDRFAICFHDWSYQKSCEYVELMDIVRAHVKPEREKVKRISHKKNWWLYGDYRKGLRKATKHLKKVLIRSMVSEHHIIALVTNNQVFSIACVIFAYDDYYHFSLLQSWIHEIWLRRQASTMRTDIRYTPTDCFQTFPFPQNPNTHASQTVESAGKIYYEYRQNILISTQKGLTDTYNRFHDLNCLDEDMKTMRLLHADMDRAVLRCYDWDDIDLEHDFYTNDRGKIRFMPSRDAQREIYTRLITLNHEIAADEASQNDG
jgi:hypothetical protein